MLIKVGRGLRQHLQELGCRARSGEIQDTADGPVIAGAVRAGGIYIDDVNGKDPRVNRNLVPTQGLLYMLGLLGAATSKEAGFYLAPYSGAVSPAANWTAANFAANATEITSLTEGFSNATRPQWVPGTAGSETIGGVTYPTCISNTASLAVFNTVCSSTVNVAGIACLSSNVRGGTGGLLLSAARYDQVRVINTGDTFSVHFFVYLADA